MRFRDFFADIFVVVENFFFFFRHRLKMATNSEESKEENSTAFRVTIKTLDSRNHDVVNGKDGIEFDVENVTVKASCYDSPCI